MGAPKGKGGKGKGKGKSSPAPAKSKGKGTGSATTTPKWKKVQPTVLVTGVSGYVAMSVARRLLDKKYKVRGTVRSLADEAKVGPLKRLFPTLELFEADLVGDQEAFEKAMDGCTFVIHCASPFQLTVADPQKDLVDPALKGTTIVMNAAVKKGISRVVLTSSVAAIGPPQPWMADPSKGDPEKIFSEEDWNDTSTIENAPYRYSKVVAEKKAWEIAKSSGMSLAVICPSFVIGPVMWNRCDGESAMFMKKMLDGTTKKQGAQGPALGVVDVRDVSQAHVNAMELDAASGKRFMVTSDTGISRIALASMIRDRFKNYPIPTEGPEPVYAPKYNSALAKEVLKFKPYPVEVSLKDMANSFIRLGIVKKAAKWSQVEKIDPDSKGINVLVKVVSLKDPEVAKNGKKLQDIVVGDSTSLVTLRLADEQIEVASTVGSVIEVRNAYVRMLNGYVRVQVDQWGKVSKHEGTDVTPNMDKDVSKTEYKLVQA